MNRIGYVLHDMENTLPYYREDGHIKWFLQTDWMFECGEYDRMVEQFRMIQCRKYLDQLIENTGNKADIQKCANVLGEVLPKGEQILVQHLKDYGEILLHVLASEMITEPLIELLKHSDRNAALIDIYCKTIEWMWVHGDDAVVNVVEVKILECLPDNQDIWQKFGTHITSNFKQWINNEALNSDYGI